MLEFGDVNLTIETFRQIVAIREEEPQAYRDLALALNEAGKYEEAVSLLYKVVTGTWSDRFTGIRRVALNEMNAIISRHPTEVNTAALEKRFIISMPVDVRIVLSWSADNSDIDLWVTEPAKEKCFYENKITQRGGSLSGDITQGYGPEEYIIKKAMKGKYTIEANLYGDSRQTFGGPITVKAELFTHFGTAAQQKKIINFRVTTDKEVVKIGELEY